MNNQTIQENTNTEQTPITNKAREAAHDVVEKVASSSAEVEKKARQGSQVTEQKVAEIVSSTQQAGQVYFDKATLYVQENPLKALGIAAASGYLISKLISNKG
tara:strand:- start:9548 stop:9856 length:309 start_codon:yes stop_codon:yes gene_type:complete